jgi:hypothetical protein
MAQIVKLRRSAVSGQKPTNSNLQLWLATASTVYLDSPATTSATTYKTQFRNPDNAASISVQKAGTLSTITLMEVTP